MIPNEITPNLRDSKPRWLMAENTQHTTGTPYRFSKSDLSRIIEMAWDDKTPFEAIKLNFNCTEKEVINLMKVTLRKGSYKKWRQRVSGRKTKHLRKSKLCA